MLKRIARKLVIGAALAAMVAPAALANPTGTDPVPTTVQTILSLLGLG
jgi:biotin transporter BioY